MRGDRRVHARLSRAGSTALEAVVGGVRRPHPVEHRLLRRGEGQAPAGVRIHRDSRATGRRVGLARRSAAWTARRIKPAFMKIGVDEAPLSDIDAKLVRAAAITHRATGSADRLSHRHGRGGDGRARPARGGRRPVVGLHLGARAIRAGRQFPRPRGTTGSLGGVRWHQPGKSWRATWSWFSG